MVIAARSNRCNDALVVLVVVCVDNALAGYRRPPIKLFEDLTPLNDDDVIFDRRLLPPLLPLLLLLLLLPLTDCCCC